MPVEPGIKQCLAFLDGQNLFHAAKEAFGWTYPNFDPLGLVRAICQRKSWDLGKVRFYTGVPDRVDNEFWSHFWSFKLAAMGRQGIHTFSRPLRYRNQTVVLADGSVQTVLVGQEKGIDVRIALDIVRLARERAYDVALVFSQDQDLSEAVDEVRSISVADNRWIKVACAFQRSPTSVNRRGINGTEWIPIDRALFAACLDPNDYRPKSMS